jgi:hypothetical protein
MDKALETQQSDLDRVARSMPAFERRSFVLGRITAATVLDAASYRWTYSWSEAILTTAGYANKTTGLSGTAVSLSELSNSATGRVSYGVNPTNLAGTGFTPVAIAVGTLVLLLSVRQLNGSQRWIIVNTQAIDGVCI